MYRIKQQNKQTQATPTTRGKRSWIRYCSIQLLFIHFRQTTKAAEVEQGLSVEVSGCIDPRDDRSSLK